MKELKLAVDWPSFVAEFTGTFGLVFFGTGAVVVNDIYGGIVGHVGIGLVFGLVITAMVFAFGERSGAHINPAVTLSFWLAGQFQRSQVITYITAQFSGAVASSFLISVFFPEHMELGTTIPTGGIARSFLLEAVLSFFLMTVIFNVARGSKETGTLAGLAIGATVGLEAIVGGPVSGASMNPARSLGPAVISGHVGELWIYLLAPLAGMILSIPVWNLTKISR